MDEIVKLEDERNKLRNEERTIIQDLRDLRTKLREASITLRDHREKRDQLNETIKVLKRERDELRNRTKQGIVQFSDFRKNTPGGSKALQAERELASLEWKVQTTPLNREEEKKLMMQIRTRESQVGLHRKLQRLRSDIDRHKQDGDTVHARIQELAEESQKHHLEIIKLRDQANQYREQLEEKEKNLESTREQALEAAQKYMEARNQDRYSSRLSRSHREMAHRDALKNVAKEKLDKGEKLSLLEMSALYGGADDEDDDDQQA